MDPYNDGSSLLQCTTILERYLVLLEVPNAPNQPNLGKISPCLFNNLHKTANKKGAKMAKNTLRVSLVISKKNPKYF
jgi:hypothetical protein